MPSTLIAADLTALLYARAAQKNAIDEIKKRLEATIKLNAEVLVQLDKAAASSTSNTTKFVNFIISCSKPDSFYKIYANSVVQAHQDTKTFVALVGKFGGENFAGYNPMDSDKIVNFRASIVADLQANEATIKNEISAGYNKLATIEANISATAAADPAAAKEAENEFNNSQNNFFKNNQTTIIVVGIVVVVIAAILIFKKF